VNKDIEKAIDRLKYLADENLHVYDIKAIELVIEALEILLEERIDKDIEYQRGFHDGYIEGQSKGLEIATNALAMQVRPIVIHCKNEEMANNFIENLQK